MKKKKRFEETNKKSSCFYKFPEQKKNEKSVQFYAVTELHLKSVFGHSTSNYLILIAKLSYLFSSNFITPPNLQLLNISSWPFFSITCVAMPSQHHKHMLTYCLDTPAPSQVLVTPSMLPTTANFI
jgi:hypothetical protein